MIGNIKETFPSKTSMQKKQVLQDPGYVGGVKDPCCMLHAASVNIIPISPQGNIQCWRCRKKYINIQPIHKVTFKKFICHIEGVEGSIH